MQKTGILPLLKTGISQVNHLYHHHIQQQGHTNCEESITIYIYKDFFYWSTLKIMNITLPDCHACFSQKSSNFPKNSIIDFLTMLQALP